MEEVTIRFPHLSQAIFDSLCNQTLTKCQIASKIWYNYLMDQRFTNKRRAVVLKKNIHKFREIPNFDANFDFASEYETLKIAIKGDFSLAIGNIVQAFIKTYRIQIQSGWNVCYSAAHLGHFEVVKFIVDNLQDNNPKNYDTRETALHLAVAYGTGQYHDLAMYIVRNVKDKNPEDKDGITPLHLAAISKDFEIVKYLISNIDDKNPGDKTGRTPLHNCAMLGHLKILTHIMDKVSNKNPGDKMGWTPLHEAIRRKWNFLIIEHIVKNIKDGNMRNPGDKNGRTPLHEAAKYGYFNVVKYLMTHAVDKNPADKTGWTPLHEAISKENYDIIRYIINNVEDKGPDDKSFFNVVKYLLQKENVPYDQGKEDLIVRNALLKKLKKMKI